MNNNFPTPPSLSLSPSHDDHHDTPFSSYPSSQASTPPSQSLSLLNDNNNSHSPHALSNTKSTLGPIKPTRNKDKLKHSESENRRRTRLRQKFAVLRDTAQCLKKDRFNILNTAIAKIQVK